jgi:hypothetical protein
MFRKLSTPDSLKTSVLLLSEPGCIRQVVSDHNLPSSKSARCQKLNMQPSRQFEITLSAHILTTSSKQATNCIVELSSCSKMVADHPVRWSESHNWQAILFQILISDNIIIKFLLFSPIQSEVFQLPIWSRHPRDLVSWQRWGGKGHGADPQVCLLI